MFYHYNIVACRMSYAIVHAHAFSYLLKSTVFVHIDQGGSIGTSFWLNRAQHAEAPASSIPTLWYIMFIQ